MRSQFSDIREKSKRAERMENAVVLQGNPDRPELDESAWEGWETVTADTCVVSTSGSAGDRGAVGKGQDGNVTRTRIRAGSGKAAGSGSGM